MEVVKRRNKGENKKREYYDSLSTTELSYPFKILSADRSNKNRVVIGSANFTKTAFQNKNQFEELLIYDDSPLFDQYLERFQELENVTIDYIPDRSKIQIGSKHTFKRS